MRIYLSPDPGEGGSAPAPSPSPAPEPAAVAAPTPAPAPAAVVAAPSPSPAPSAPTESPRLIDKMPERGSDAYMQHYHRLSPQEREQVRGEIDEIESGKAEGQGKWKAPAAAAPVVPVPVAATPAVPLPGDAPAPTGTPEPIDETDLLALETAVEKLTPEQIAALPPEVKTALDAGKKAVAGFRFLDSERVKYGFLANDNAVRRLADLYEDPVIKARIQERDTGKSWQPTEAVLGIVESRLPEFVGDDFVKNLTEIFKDFVDSENGELPTEGYAKIGALMKPALAAAVKESARLVEQNLTSKHQYQQRVLETKQRMDTAMLTEAQKYPQFKPTDPSITDPWDARHPLSKVMHWAAERRMDRFFTDPSVKNGPGAVMAAYLAENGTLNEAFRAARTGAVDSLIKKMDDAQRKQAVSLPASTVHAPTPANPEFSIPGIDLQRYAVDAGYRQDALHQAQMIADPKARGDRLGQLRQLSYKIMEPSFSATP